MLFEYLNADALLGKFFEPFIFEKFPASDNSVSTIYLNKVAQCDIYLGIFGKEYGFQDRDGISPTEREFDHAVLHHKTRLIFLSNHTSLKRDPKELYLIKKAEQSVVRKQFSSFSELKVAVYASLIRYLEENEYIRTVPFDAVLNNKAEMDDLDIDKIRFFVTSAKHKRKFPLSTEKTPEEILTHLNLFANGRITNAALLLFGKKPQRFFITSEIKCAHFHGTEIVKPIPSYQVYKGDVFELVDQAVDFVLSKIDLSVGERIESNQAPVNYEIPVAAVKEAIVNAVAHRDYTSNASVQVMLFKDRLEIWNPGILPFGLTTVKLREAHPSIPGNPLLAEPMYLAGYIERMGTGTRDIIRLCKESGLQEPEFIQEETFRVIIWRKKVDMHGSDPVTAEVPQKHRRSTVEVERIVLAMDGQMKRQEIQRILGLKHEGNFRDIYLLPALTEGYIEMTRPDNPNHPQQKYKLTEKGREFKQLLQNVKNES